MAITGPASYIPTTDEFLAHWASADKVLFDGGGTAMVLLKEVNREALVSLRKQLEGKRAEVESARIGREIARAAIEEGKAGLLARLNQFKRKISSLVPDSPWEAVLPKAYSVTESYGKVIPPLDEMADLWERYEREVGLLQLMGKYERAAFMSDLAALKTAYTTYISTDHALSFTRSERAGLEKEIYGVLKAYRRRIPSEFPADHPLMDTLPRLSPAETAHDPVPVQANGLWNPGTQTAELNWTASSDPDLARYEVRAVAGPDYEEDDETIVATLPPGATRVWTGDYSLSTPGSAASFRVYVVLTTGHEKGSNPVTVLRPSAV